MNIIRKIIVFTFVLHSLAGIAQNPDYFEFQVQDPSAIQLTDEQLGKLYNRWYLTDYVEHKLGVESSLWVSSSITSIFLDWNGKASNKIDFRIISNKYIFFKKKEQCYGCIDGLFSITKFNDSTLVLVKHFRSDYKWFYTYTFKDYKHYEIDKRKKEKASKQIIEAEKAFVQREDSLREQKHSVWIRLEEAKRDSVRMVEKELFRKGIAQKYNPGKTIETDTLFSKEGTVQQISLRVIIVENGYGDIYQMESKPINPVFYKNGIAITSEKFWEAYQKE